MFFWFISIRVGVFLFWFKGVEELIEELVDFAIKDFVRNKREPTG